MTRSLAATPQREAPPETVIFANPILTVSDAQLVVKGQTYVMARIRSACMRRVPPDRKAGVWMTAAGAGCGLVFGTAFAIQLTNPYFGLGSFLLLAVVSLLVAVMGIARLLSAKVMYGLAITLPSGEVQVLTSDSGGEIATYVAAVTRAISLNPRNRA